MHVYQMHSSIPSVVSTTQERMQVCMDALKQISNVWLVAKMVYTLFESILGNKLLEDRLQKAAGKRHKKSKFDPRPAREKDEPQQKRKYEQMDLGFNNAPPVPQVLYERSRAETPAVTPSRDLSQCARTATLQRSPKIAQLSEGFLGGTYRGDIRPTTPFNSSCSILVTPPNLFLVTRDSPHISQSLWENFQPNQLFPENTHISSPIWGNQQNLDPQLHMPQIQSTGHVQPAVQGQAQNPPSKSIPMQGQENTQGMEEPPGLMRGVPESNSGQDWPGQYLGDGQNSDDNWTTSNRATGGDPLIPTTLNVEDWYVANLPWFLRSVLTSSYCRFQFFGMNSDLSGLNAGSRGQP